MDDHRFDDLARHVASAAATRRSAIKALLGAITGGALTLTGDRERRRHAFLASMTVEVEYVHGQGDRSD